MKEILHSTDIHLHPLIRIAIAHYEFETVQHGVLVEITR